MDNKVRELRIQTKKTMKELSKETGIGLSTISNYENGYSNPKKKNAQILAEYFGVSIPYLLGLDDNPVLKDPGSTKEILKGFNKEKGKEINDLIFELNLIQISKRELLEQYLALDTQEKDILHKIKEVSNER